ncbi:MAG: hypothetical protein Q9218_008243, partial [Villophora microphyllina]
RPLTPGHLGEDEVLALLESINPLKWPVVHRMIVLGSSHWVFFEDRQDRHRALQAPSRKDRDYDARNQAAVQEYLAQLSDKSLRVTRDQDNFLRVPRVLAYDATATSANVLGRQYVIQTSIPGSPLAYHLRAFSKLDRLRFIPELTAVLNDMQRVMFPHSGRLVAAAGLPDKKGLRDRWTATGLRAPVPIFEYEAKSHSILEVGPFLQTSRAYTGKTAMYATLRDLMYDQFKAWYTSERLFDLLSGSNDPHRASQRILYGIAKKMKGLGLFERQEPNVLWHRELGPNTIFVDNSNGRWQITGIVGWKHVLSVPRVLTREPPKWLWTSATNIGQWSEEEWEVKNAFEDYMERTSPGWGEDAYGTGYWIRRLARFALDQFQFREDFEDYEILREDWAGE